MSEKELLIDVRLKIYLDKLGAGCIENIVSAVKEELGEWCWNTEIDGSEIIGYELDATVKEVERESDDEH